MRGARARHWAAASGILFISICALVAVCHLGTRLWRGATAQAAADVPAGRDAARTADSDAASAVEPLVLRRYDVGDLLAASTDRALPDGLVLLTGSSETEPRPFVPIPLFGSHEEAPRLGLPVMTSPLLADTITEMIEPYSWRHGGYGGRGIIECANRQLFVVQAAAVHAQIEEFLATLRKARRAQRTLHVVATWLSLDDAKFDLLFPTGSARAEGLLSPPRDVLNGPAALYRGRTTCMDGQQVNVVSGNVLTVSDVSLCIAEVIAYFPSQSYCISGPSLQFRGFLGDSGEGVRVDVCGTATKSRGLGQIPFAELGATGGDHIMLVPRGPDRTDFAAHSVGSAVCVPLDRPVLIGGINAPELAGGKKLYLVLEVSAGPAAREGAKP